MTDAADGAGLVTDPAPARSREVGPYEIHSLIGRGAMGSVWLARQPVLDRWVALKELAPGYSGDLEAARRFLREARLAGSISHANIVTVFDYLEHDGRAFIAMEYMRRGSLRPWVGTMTVPQVVGVMEDVLGGLAAAERHGVVHRDLKPENLLVTDDGSIKIADFGVAKAAASVGLATVETATGMAMGTPAYMAPEQVRGDPVDARADLYGVGVIAFELLAGFRPFRGESPMALLLQHANEPPPPLAGVHPRLRAWVEALLAKDPAARLSGPGAAWEMLEEAALEAVGPRWRREARLGETPEPEPERGEAGPEIGERAPATGTPGPIRRLRAASARRLALTVALLAVAAVAAAFFLGSESNPGRSPADPGRSPANPGLAAARTDVNAILVPAVDAQRRLAEVMNEIRPGDSDRSIRSAVVAAREEVIAALRTVRRLGASTPGREEAELAMSTALGYLDAVGVVLARRPKKSKPPQSPPMSSGGGSGGPPPGPTLSERRAELADRLRPLGGADAVGRVGPLLAWDRARQR